MSSFWCKLCQDLFLGEEPLPHFERLHPEAYAELLRKWPDRIEYKPRASKANP